MLTEQQFSIEIEILAREYIRLQRKTKTFPNGYNDGLHNQKRDSTFRFFDDLFAHELLS